MQKIHISIAAVALIIGIGIGYFLPASDKEVSHMMPNGSAMPSPMHQDMQGEMKGMMSGLEGKTGDEFDRAFLSEMIIHHEGAVDMAEAALSSAKHSEIKEMANAIIAAQTTEIKQMKAWMSAWYGE